MFKGPDKDIEFIYTAPSTAVCGQPLDTGGKKEYLIAGRCWAGTGGGWGGADPRPPGTRCLPWGSRGAVRDGLSGSVSPGKSEGNGKMHITLCDLVATWDSLSPTQKKSLNQRYQMGCECKVSAPGLGLGEGGGHGAAPRPRAGGDGVCCAQISRCLSIPCFVSSSDECLWTDWAMEKIVGGRQAKHYACIKRSDGSCAWYRGMAPPKQEFLDIEDP